MSGRIGRSSGSLEPRRRRAAGAAASLAAASLLAAAACERAPGTVFDEDIVPRRLTLRTYEGSGQVVHPDVVAAPDLPGGPFWLAVTPYPNSREKFENPSIYRSRDGLVWEEPKAALNPIVPRPPFGHNCDPDLVRDRGRFTLLYLETQREEFRPDSSSFQKLLRVTSADGVEWSPPATLLHWDLDRDPFYLSPCLVRVDDAWRLYLVEPKERRIVWMPSTDGAAFGPPGGELATGLPGVRPWHLDVFEVPGGWVALLCARGPNAASNSDVDLWIGASVDLERWAFEDSPLLAASPALLDTEDVYRSTGLVRDGRLAVWFSAKDRGGVWFLGVATYDARRVTALLDRSGRTSSVPAG